MNERISVAIITKNAADYLPRCLQSVSWADEIVLLDGHSTDETQTIARKFGAKVIEKKFESFPAERVYVLQHTSYDWVLSVDADMIVPPALASEIQAIMLKGPDSDAYLMRCLNHFLGREIRHCSWFDYSYLRLFNKNKGAYDTTTKVVDPFICTTGRIGKLKNILVHHQTETLEEYIKKMAIRYAPLTADEYIAKGVQIFWWNVPWYFFIKPTLIFLYKYIWKLGFMDGLPGLVICLNSAILYYSIASIIWDRQKGIPDYKFERYL